MRLPTPETDASEMPIDRIDTVASRPCRVVISEFARKLERERDESRERLTALCQHFGADGVVDLAVKLLRLERERDNALSDAKQADTDSIRALAERNEAREKLAAERALADRLAKIVKEGLEGMDEYDHPFVTEVRNTLAAWKEARND